MKNAFILMDYQNQSVDPELTVKKVSEFGNVIGGKAYGNWAKYPSKLIFSFSRNGIELIEMPEEGPNKKGNDIKLAVDAMELMFNLPHIEIYVLITGDADFLPLVRKLKNYGKSVIIISRRKSMSGELQIATDMYIAYDDIVKTEEISDIDTIDDIVEEVIKIIEDKNFEINEHNIKRILSGMNISHTSLNYPSVYALNEDIIKKITHSRSIKSEESEYEDSYMKFIERLIVTGNIPLNIDTLSEMAVKKNLWMPKHSRKTLKELIQNMISAKRLRKNNDGTITVPPPREWELKYTNRPYPELREKFVSFIYKAFFEKRVNTISEAINLAKTAFNLSNKVISSFGTALKFSGQFVGTDGYDYVSLNTPVVLTGTEEELLISLTSFYIKNILKQEDIYRSELKALSVYIIGKEDEKAAEHIMKYLIDKQEVTLDNDCYMYQRTLPVP